MIAQFDLTWFIINIMPFEIITEHILDSSFHMFIKLASTNQKIKIHLSYLSTIYKVRALIKKPHHLWKSERWGIHVSLVIMRDPLHHFWLRGLSERCVYLTEIQLSPQQNYRDLRSAYFVSYGALDFIERFSNGAGPMPPRGTILLTRFAPSCMYVTERGFALRVD